MPAATPDDYYDHLPEPRHAAGDIWCGLPSYGVLKQERVSGIIITPACDLQNSKSETLTYLPILSIDAWFATFPSLTDARGTTATNINNLNNTKSLGQPLPALSQLPSLDELNSVGEAIRPLQEDPKHGNLVMQILAGLETIQAILTSTTLSISPATLARLYGAKAFLEKCQKIVQNNHRTDIHFLPGRSAWATAGDESFARHSVAMFRYPLTAPIDILDRANDDNIVDWKNSIAPWAALPSARFFLAERPVRVARLQPRFFADLLSRYTALYARVGSPDFPTALVSRLAADIVRSS